MNTYGFIGLGLIGGSLAKNLKKVQPDCRIMAYARTRQTLEDAHRQRIIDEILEGPADPLLSACDMIFLCAPVGSNIEALRALSSLAGKDCIITDVGSVKTGIHEQAQALGLTDRFIGGHPMTGSEKSGLDASNDHLFENAYYIITPEKDVPEEKVTAYRSLIESFLALPLIIPYQEHDYITAAVSHLPHVIASSLVNTVHNLDQTQHMKLIAAGGFKDITRIASSSPEMWEHICVSNHKNITRVMDEFICLLIAARDHMNAGDGTYIHQMFEESRDYRDSFSDMHHGVLKKSYRIYCDIIDEAGAIATIATILAVGRINIKNIGIVHNREFEDGALRIEFYDGKAMEKAAQILTHHRYQIWKR